MGIRGEVFSTKVALQNRTYFFNVKENRMGDLYLNIVESKNKETGGFDRQSLVLFADDLQEFLSGFDESLRVMEKAVREKRKNTDGPRGGKAPGAKGAANRTGSPFAAGSGASDKHGYAPKTAARKSRGDKTKSGEAPSRGRRVVVRKDPKAPGRKPKQ